MVATLEELAKASTDKHVQGFVNEMVTDSYLLETMPFDNCLTPTGTSNLTYSYNRVTEPMTAKFRSLGEEPKVTDIEFSREEARILILSASFTIDRVAKDAAPDLLAQKFIELKNSIIRLFNRMVIDPSDDMRSHGAVGLRGLLTNRTSRKVHAPTAKTSTTDLSTIDKKAAMNFASEMDDLFSELIRTPDVLLVSPHMKTKLNAMCRELGISGLTPDTAGHQVPAWDGIRIEVLKDGALTTDDVYAVCLGMDAFHGITLTGDKGVTVSVPDWSQPGAVKKGDAELVAGVALRAVRAAGVLRSKAGSDPGPAKP